MLYMVLRFTDFPKLQETILKISPLAAAAVVMGYVVGQILSSFKWWTIARAGGIQVPYTSALKAYFVGMFVNCFGLGTLGGDLARGILLAEGKPVKTRAVASVVADRAHGLAVLSFIGLMCVSIAGRYTMDIIYVYLLIGVSSSIVLGWFLGPRILKAIVKPEHPWRQKVESLVAVFPHDPKTIFFITLVSVLFHCVQISLHQLMASALGIYIPWTYLFVVIPFVNILASLPISWNGLGVRENAYVFFLVPALLTQEQAVAFGTMWLLAVTVSSAIGGVISVLTRDFEELSAAEEAERVGQNQTSL